MKHQQRFIWFDFIRGLCALLVCAGHLRSVMFVDYGSRIPQSLLNRLFYLATGLGHQSVMIFFVLSGFFVGGMAMKRRTSFNLNNYLTARLVRLWVVLLPALLITAIVDYAVSQMAPEFFDGAYKTIWHSGPADDQPYELSVRSLLGNLAFFQTWLVPVFGSNGPLWSLANEFWYYVLFALIMLGAQGQLSRENMMRPLGRLSSILLAALILVLMPRDMAGGFAIWILGIVVSFSMARLSVTRARVLVIIGLAGIAVSLVYAKFLPIQKRLGIPSDLFVGLTFCVLCIGIVNANVEARLPGFFVTGSKMLSEFSFSLYLLHFPLVVLIGLSFYREERLDLNAKTLLEFFCWLLTLVLSGFLFYLIFERNTAKIRGFLTLTRLRQFVSS